MYAGGVPDKPSYEEIVAEKDIVLPIAEAIRLAARS